MGALEGTPSTTLATKGSLTHHVERGVIRHFPTKPGITPSPPPPPPIHPTPPTPPGGGGRGGEGVGGGVGWVVVHNPIVPEKEGGPNPSHILSLYIPLSLSTHTPPIHTCQSRRLWNPTAHPCNSGDWSGSNMICTLCDNLIAAHSLMYTHPNVPFDV